MVKLDEEELSMHLQLFIMFLHLRLTTASKGLIHNQDGNVKMKIYNNLREEQYHYYDTHTLIASNNISAHLTSPIYTWHATSSLSRDVLELKEDVNYLGAFP